MGRSVQILLAVLVLLPSVQALRVIQRSCLLQQRLDTARRRDLHETEHCSFLELPWARATRVRVPFSQSYGLLQRLSKTTLQAVKFRNFDEMLHTFPDTVILVNFYARWCGPCRLMKKELESVHQALGDGIKIFTVDTERWPNVGVRYKVEGLPCAMLFKGGEILHRIDGLESADELLRQIQTFL